MVGGIHTVLATKVREMQAQYGDDYIVIGPDLPADESGDRDFREEIWLPEVTDELTNMPIGTRMGRWLVPGEPRCLLINYTDLVAEKDRLLTNYWERYGLDSLLGGWDYLEPLMFAHGAGMAVEALSRHYYLPEGKQPIAHAHEWLTGASLLYLRYALPEVATVFTTHATVLGRALAGSNGRLELPGDLQGLQPADMARQHHVSAKHSMETIAAAAADCFTTVSEITAEECAVLLGRAPDVVTPNALGDEFPNPAFAEPAAAAAARTRLLELAGLATGTVYPPEKTRVLLTSGRYEFVNKGVDQFIDALGQLRPRPDPEERTVAFFMLPAAHNGPRRSVLRAVSDGAPTGEIAFSTHDLLNETADPVVTGLRARGITNDPASQVHAVFIPIYLDGNDPLIRETYYQLLAGADVTVFPSLYEPWGYTPMESTGYGVPTVTSDLAGYGRWALENGRWPESGVQVLRRQGRPRETTVAELAAMVEAAAWAPAEGRPRARAGALATSRLTRWEHFGESYARAHEFACREATARAVTSPADRFRAAAKRQVVTPGDDAISAHLRDFVVLNRIPPTLETLRQLSRNAWWSWHPEAAKLFEELDAGLWASSGHNPTLLLDRTTVERLDAVQTPEYLERLRAAADGLRDCLATRRSPEVAYFSAEFGVLNSLRFYSGGLGTLAGDFLKASSDLNLPVCGVGLAYHRGYFRQRFRSDGSQEPSYDRNDFLSAPMELVLDDDSQPLVVIVAFPGGPVRVRAWRVAVGNVDLFLLDTDFEENRPSDRTITDVLYGGDNAHRLRQELVLGIGGYRLLRALGLNPRVYHMNEGHSAFLLVARIGDLVNEQGLKFEEALEYVRATSVFTTHTPVAAGHDRFPEELLRPFFGRMQQLLHKDWDDLSGLGADPGAGDDRVLSVTYMALNGSRRANAVSKIHGRVARRMFQARYPGLYESEVPVAAITNGVHTQTWLAPEWQALFAKLLGEDWDQRLGDESYWERVRSLDRSLVWDAHLKAKARLRDWLRQHVQTTFTRRRENPGLLQDVLAGLNEDTLFVGFARRFAPYKRANLLFEDLEELRALTSSPRPVFFVFAGKAHPSDELGQSLARRIIEVSRMPEFRGRMLLVEDYEIAVAQLLVAGCDLWLNTPTPPLEASGTSGMKAAINGVLNLSVADGWWPEAYNGKNGWMFGGESLESRESQDAYDAAEIYALLGHQVAPLFFDRDGAGVPQGWVERMQESIATVLPKFSMVRMALEYDDLMYRPAMADAEEFERDGFARLSAIVEARKRLVEAWPALAFVDAQVDGLESERLTVGEPITARVDLHHPGLTAQDLEVQVVLTEPEPAGSLHDFRVVAMEPKHGGRATSAWEARIILDDAGARSLGFRVVPRNHQDALAPSVPLVKWL
jgi:phosphorylase/glycogen(starch) synthase